jgi:uncharacterized membrane protein
MDEDIFFALVGLAAIGIFFAPLILSLVAMSRTGDLRRRIAALEARLSAQASAVMETAIEPAPAEHVVEVALPLQEPSSEPAEAVGTAPGRAYALEERLTSRWLVWLGAVALVFAGLFLVKYSIDNGLLTPEMRVILGLLLGIGLIAAGEAIRRRQPVASAQNYIPGALTSAGLFICFATVYAGQALLGVVSPGVAFAGLAVIALAAFALGALHTPIVAVIGLLAGYATPILVGSGPPSAALFFGYLALIGAAAYAVVFYRAWGWLAYGVLAGSLIWVALWIFGPLIEPDLLVLAVFLAALTAASMWLALAFTPPEVPPVWRDPKRQGQGPEINAWLAASGSVLLFAWAVAQTGASFFGLALAAVGTFGLAFAGRRWQRFDGLAVHAGVLLALALLGWDPAEAIASVSRSEQAGNIIAAAGALMAPAAQPFVFAHLAGAAFIAVLGFVILRGASRPFVFAGASLVTGAVILALAYARIYPITTDTLWALVSAGAAALAVAAAGALNTRRDDWSYRLSLGFYAAAAAAGIAFTLAFVFRQAWLTVALSLELPALAWLERRLQLRELRHLALAIAAAVLIRLALNPYVLDYDAAETLGAQWIVYGYSVPALAFYVAAQLFRATIADRAVIVLETGALAFALLLASLEIRIFTEGRIAAPSLTLYELSLHTLVWLAVAWWRARAYVADRRAADAWWFAVVGGVAFAVIVFGQLVAFNPVLTGEPVGDRPILDTLLIAYFAPAVLIALIAKEMRLIPTIGQRVSIVLFAVALVLAMTWLTLETKRFFQGPQLTVSSQSDAEYYAYSVVWLLSSFLMLGLGLWRRSAWLRHGALAILILTVLKVFLSDMAALGGLYRVASFLGLGLCLVGIGYVYQRFVFTGRPAPPVTG